MIVPINPEGKKQLDLIWLSKALKTWNCPFYRCVLCMYFAVRCFFPNAGLRLSDICQVHACCWRFVLCNVWNALEAGRLWLDSQYYGDLSHKLLEGREFSEEMSLFDWWWEGFLSKCPLLVTVKWAQCVRPFGLTCFGSSDDRVPSCLLVSSLW